MGLAVVHGIVEHHGGSISVDSTPGKGTLVSILFPEYQAAASGEIVSEDPLPSGSERILLIDDEPAVVAAVRQLLERLGYGVEATTNPRDALEMFTSDPNRYDLVITDMSMPDMPGDLLASSVLAIRPDIPVILCTGFSEKIDGDRARNIGIRCYMEKPIDKRRLARAVRRALEGGGPSSDPAGAATITAC